MFVRVAGNLRVTLEEPQDLKRFHVEIPRAVEPEAAARALAGIGRLVGEDNAWVSESAVRALPGAPSDAAWRQGWDKMISYAAKSGWIDPTSNEIKAHIVWK